MGDRTIALRLRAQRTKEVVPDERAAPTVKRIFDLYTREQLGTAAVARVLADEHAPAPAAGWQPAVVQWVLENEAYLGKVIWRGEALPGLHEVLVDEFTFARAQRLLRERGDDMARRRSNPGDYLLSGLLRCGRCKRAYVGMSAKGNGGTYHYYACSGRQKLGPKGCDGERIPRDKLEAAVVDQLTSLYRDGDVIRDAIGAAAAQRQSDGAALEDQRRALAEEIRRAERALDRYYAAFETGDLDAKRFQTRTVALETRLADLHEQDLALAARLAPQAPTTPDAANLASVADQLEDLVSTGDPKQTKALLRLLVKDLRVNGRSEILPTYRVVTDTVCTAKFSGPNWAAFKPANSPDTAPRERLQAVESEHARHRAPRGGTLGRDARGKCRASWPRSPNAGGCIRHPPGELDSDRERDCPQS